MKLKQLAKISLAITIVLLLSNIANASFLDDEAGISAYSTVSTVDMAAAATAYKNIEYQTSEYIIGSVAIPNYDETHDVHVYLHSSGEIIAYYLRDRDLCHMIDWRAYHSTKQITGSKLHTALGIIASAMSVTLSEIKLYDFRYPDAPNIKIIVDGDDGTDSFRFLVPNSYIVHKSFWSHAVLEAGGSNFVLDDVTIDSMSTNSYCVARHGELLQSQLTQDEYHTVSVTGSYAYGYVAIVVLYSEPQ